MIQLTLKPDQHFELTLGTETWRSAYPASAPQVMQATLAVELTWHGTSESKVLKLWVAHTFATILFGQLAYSAACDVWTKMQGRDQMLQWLQNWAGLAIDMAKDLRKFIADTCIVSDTDIVPEPGSILVPAKGQGGGGHGIA